MRIFISKLINGNVCRRKLSEKNFRFSLEQQLSFAGADENSSITTTDFQKEV
jgi:hypothetical protein